MDAWGNLPIVFPLSPEAGYPRNIHRTLMELRPAP
jgi:hypothetical protein